ncbi:ADP-ribosylation factor 1 [Perkinsela sp. CCAP 1560/4]|nr:ADP-ribosylation factor 1 [Perkinsela sp. CCAP 1560/4]|eukprot:KNH07430.1 ADP-ribosylation factor 1 [Perkinsela sp. CCAP 1560/4]
MIGLDSAGKTTILNALRFSPHERTIPTVGFNVESVRYKNVQFDVWDLGGQDALRPLWGHYYDDADAVIYVVDSHDKARIDEARAALMSLLCDRAPRKVPLLLFCNKQDFDDSWSVREVLDHLGLRSFVGYRDWFAQGCCASSGEGIYEGLEWLSDRFDEAGK